MTKITLDALGKTFGMNAAIEQVTLEFASGAFVALLGPSGCGKTTLLRLIAGFEQPSAGRISFDDAVVADAGSGLPPEKRQLGMVFQSYALWPHMNVAANVAYPLNGRGLSREEIARRVSDALAMVSLSRYGERNVDALSGGQRQRVALARCLVTGTRIILLDEPLANLDVHLRAAMLDVFADIHQRTGATIVFVTHDQSEALALADQIVVLDSGKVQQVGSPQEIYTEPANAMVANFVGRGALIDAHVEAGQARIGETIIQARGQGKGAAKLLIRPQAVRLAEAGLPANVSRVRYTGANYQTSLTLASGASVLADLPQRLAVDTPVHLCIDDAWIVPA